MGQANLERHRREARFGEPIACLAFPKWAKERAFIVSGRRSYVRTIINIHHYFIDNVIWRRDNPEMKSHLFGA